MPRVPRTGPKIPVDLTREEIAEILKLFRVARMFWDIFQTRKIFDAVPPGGQFHRGLARKLSQKISAGREKSAPFWPEKIQNPAPPAPTG